MQDPEGCEGQGKLYPRKWTRIKARVSNTSLKKGQKDKVETPNRGQWKAGFCYNSAQTVKDRNGAHYGKENIN